MSSIDMPWPDKRVWPNWRQSHHWRTYYKPVKAQRIMAFALARNAGMVGIWDDDARVVLTVDIYPPDRRRRDRDGMAGALKSAFDGIADAIGIDDQYFAPVYNFHDPVKGGKIVITIAP